MRLLDRLILKDLIGPFINGFLMFMILVFAAGSLFQATEWLVQGIPTITVVKLVLFSIPSLITQVLPMAMLLAGLLGFGRLSADREIVAIFAAGIAFPRMARMVLIMGALVSIIAFAWNDRVVPAASTAFWDLKIETFKHIGKEDKPLFRTIDNKDSKGVEEAVSVNGGYDAKARIFRRVNILKFDPKPERRGQPLVNIYCDQVRFRDDHSEKATYEHGYFTLYRPDSKTGVVEGMTVTFDTLTLLPNGATIGKSFEEVLKSDVTDPNRRSFRDLQKDIQIARKAGEDVRGREVDLYGKISLPFASFIFGIVGAALGCNTARGKTVGFGTAIFIVFIYWVFYHAFFVVGKNGSLPPIVASFVADIVGAVGGLILAARVGQSKK